MAQLIVHNGRTTVVPVSLGYDVSNDTLTSEIRASVDPASALIAAWDVSFSSDGTDGELILTLDNSALASNTRTVGYMDIKRVSGGEPLSVFDEPLEVVFKNPVTS